MSAIPYLIAAALVFGPAAAWQASRRLRNPAVWLALGALLGPVALGLLLIAPPGQCPACAERTRGFASICSTCGSSLASGRSPADRPSMTSAGPDDGAPVEVPVARELPALGGIRGGDPTAVAAAVATAASTALTEGQPDRLTAVGARRPGEALDARNSIPMLQDARASGLTILAIGVFVQGSEPLAAGSRYLIARTAQRLIIIGPVEASSEHVELELPLDEVEATYVPDRLVVSGWTERRSRRWVLGFQSIAGLTPVAIDTALLTDSVVTHEALGRA